MEFVKIQKACIGESLISCDRCGAVGKVGEFPRVYFGPHGEHIDLCRRCFEGEEK